MKIASDKITVHYWSTPNGRKITVCLEELGVPYEVNFVNINKRENWEPAFEKVSPHHQIPALTDPDGPGGEPISMFETGAILLYLGRKFGQFYPTENQRAQTLVEQWLMWQMGNFGPFLGQLHHFRGPAPEKIDYAIDRYQNTAKRLYTVLDNQLEGRAYVADDYSIADMAIFPWAHRHPRQRVDLEDYPNVKRWYDSLAAREPVQRGMAVSFPGHVDVMVPKPAWEKSE